MKNKTVILSALLLTLLAALLLAGCGAKDYKGPQKTNVNPEVDWADIGVNPTHSQNPNLRWHSSDADGQVIDYQYFVMLTSAVDLLGGAQAVADNPPLDVSWTIVHNDSATIQLYASPDTSIFLEQYVFLRAMDDDSAFSPIIYRPLARNNHAPTCYLIVPWIDEYADGRRSPDEPIDPQWCLPETTATWKGVRVAWVGKDSIDVRGIQPDFDWDVRIYGPFADSASCDTLPEQMHGRLVNASGDIWVRLKQYYFTNLRSGWYKVYVRNRDDAFVPSMPAIEFLRIYEPTWVSGEATKPILVANHNYYWTLGSFIPPGYDGELLGMYRDSVEQFYRTLLASAGITTDQYDWIDYTIGQAERTVQKADLYNHRLVIVLDTDWTHPLKDEPPQLFQENPYSLYLNVGGKMWVIGRKSFEGNVAGRNDFGVTNHPFAQNFFNLSATFAEPLANPSQAEFAGATSLMSGFPDLVIAPERVNHTTNPRNTYTNALRGVGYVIRLPESETIYKFQSIGPDTSAFHNFPVAIRYDRGTWKTSYFCFPLYFISTPEAVEVTRLMIDWFFDGEL